MEQTKKQQVEEWIKSKKLNDMLLKLAKIKVSMDRFYQIEDGDYKALVFMVDLINDGQDKTIEGLISTEAKRSWESGEFDYKSAFEKIYKYLIDLNIPKDYFVVAKLQEDEN